VKLVWIAITASPARTYLDDMFSTRVPTKCHAKRVSKLSIRLSDIENNDQGNPKVAPQQRCDGMPIFSGIDTGRL
jgi:hypothetical protein